MNLKVFGLFATILLLNLSSIAQENENDDTINDTIPGPWEINGSISFNFTRVNLSNWAGGGQSSISLATGLKASANYVTKKHKWENSLDMAYGITRVGDSDDEFKKSDDNIILISKYGYDIFDKRWYFSSQVDFRSQIATGLRYVPAEDESDGERGVIISRFMAPGFLLVASGLEYKVKDDFYASLSPVTGKFTFVLEEKFSERGDFGVEPGERVRTQLGSLIKTGFKRKIMENVDLETNLVLFSDFETFIEEIDVNWDATLVFKVNKWLQTTYTTLLIYDEDTDVERDDGSIGPAVQWKDVMKIGLLLTF